MDSDWPSAHFGPSLVSSVDLDVSGCLTPALFFWQMGRYALKNPLLMVTTQSPSHNSLLPQTSTQNAGMEGAITCPSQPSFGGCLGLQ